MSEAAAAGRWERAAVAGSLAAATALAWAYTIPMALSPAACHAAAAPRQAPWGAADAASAFAMWAVMMAGMMLPTAIPVSLTLAVAGRAKAPSQGALVPVGFFVFGYLLVWTAYSGAAALAQWGLHKGALLSPSLALGPASGGALLVAAGAFQWTPWKDACMVKCRSPLGFLLSHWRTGPRGALSMGIRYGGYCVGCCWLLMTLSFALGVMNLAWMAVVTLFMVAEKVLPGGQAFSRSAGALLAAWGAGMISGAVLG